MTARYRTNKKHYDILSGVTTVAEVCQRWGKHRSTVRNAIDAENLAAEQSGTTWLISVASVIDYWGEPTALPHATPKKTGIIEGIKYRISA